MGEENEQAWQLELHRADEKSLSAPSNFRVRNLNSQPTAKQTVLSTPHGRTRFGISLYTYDCFTSCVSAYLVDRVIEL